MKVAFRRTLNGVVLATLALAAATHAQSTGERPNPRLVHLDAIAADAQGRRVQDLTAADFEVVEHGETRSIANVQFVRALSGGNSVDTAAIGTTEDEQAAAGRIGTRLFAIFLDEYHVSPGDATERARAALMAFVDRDLGPRDMVLVVRPLDSLPSLRLTRDHDVIRAAIAQFSGRKGDLTPRTAFEQNYIPPDPARIEAVRAQIVVSALNAIAAHLGPLNIGRKTIIVLSEGFEPPVRRRGDLALPVLDGVVRAANRSNASIYAIDPRAFAVGAPDGDVSASLRTLAEQTDGRAIIAPADLADGFQRIVSDASGYYVIAFEPPDGDETGRFHPVAIQVRRAGVTLRTRTGYWERPPDAASILRKAAEPAFSVVRHTSPLMKPWFGMARGEGGKTRVQFVWEPAPTLPGVRSRAAAPVRASLTVLDTKGAIITQQDVGPKGSTSDLVPSQGVFDLEPGKFVLHIDLEDADANLLDTDIRDLTVAAFDGPMSLGLGTAQVFRARNAREMRAIEADPNSPPVIERQFSRADYLIVRVPVYGKGNGSLMARLVTRFGGQMRELPVTTPADSEWRLIELPLAGLAAGEYRIELSIAGQSSGGQDSIAFRVTP